VSLTNTADVVAALDTELAEFVEAFTNGEYALWLGSAISKYVVPDLEMLLGRALELLRANIDVTANGCPFRAALEEVLDVAGVDGAVRSAIDFNDPVDSWPSRDDVIGRLIDRYSDVLDVHPSGQDADYLVWSGLDAPNTYGDPTLKPDAEHLSVAILMLEGIASTTQTTNWDGLIEAAVAHLIPNPDSVLRVVVTPADFRKPQRRGDLLKFHGCAVRARDDESTYRPLLIARKSQISGWTTRPENRLMKERLQHVYSTSTALVVGLSAQDANIHTVFNQAIANLGRHWPASPPGVMIASQRLGHHHKHVLRVTYGDAYAPNDTEIDAASLLGAYAKPALSGLVLFTLFGKLRTLLRLVPGLNASDTRGLEIDFQSLRDKAATAAGTDERTFILALVDAVNLASHIFRKGQLPASGTVPYEPISTRPINEAVHDADYPKEALGRMTLALALLARAHDRHGWLLRAGSTSAPTEGVISIESGRRKSKVFIVRDTRESLALTMAGYTALDPGSTVVIQTNSEAPTQTRSPRTRYGRTGRTDVRRVNMEDLVEAMSNADELFESFTLQGAF
jgi:hypothetical protein